jgi:hypothetical protein
MAKRRCKGNTKAGKRCKAPPLKNANYCRAHDPSLPDDARFGSPDQAAAAGRVGGGHNRKPRMTEEFRERVDQLIEVIVAVHLEAMTATRPIQVGYGESAYTAEIPDHRTRLAAANSLLDRAHGRPRQSTEITGEGGGPIRVSEQAFADPKVRKAMADVVKRVGAARAGKPGRAGPSD